MKNQEASVLMLWVFGQDEVIQGSLGWGTPTPKTSLKVNQRMRLDTAQLHSKFTTHSADGSFSFRRLIGGSVSRRLCTYDLCLSHSFETFVFNPSNVFITFAFFVLLPP